MESRFVGSGRNGRQWLIRWGLLIDALVGDLFAVLLLLNGPFWPAVAIAAIFLSLSVLALWAATRFHPARSLTLDQERGRMKLELARRTLDLEIAQIRRAFPRFRLTVIDTGAHGYLIALPLDSRARLLMALREAGVRV